MNFQVLTNEQINRIHAASIRILETVGVRIPHATVREKFRQAKAEVDESAEMVKIPEHLVMDSLNKAGKSFCVFGRDFSKQARFGFGECNYNSIAGEAHWVDDYCLERRPASLDDVITATRFCDALEHINVVGAMSDPQELPPSYRCVEVAAEQLKNTTKPITFWFHDRKSAKYVLELFAAVAGSEKEAMEHPYAYHLLEPISPLKFPYHGIDLLFETCRYPLPVQIGPMAQVGATAPGTLAGTLVQENGADIFGHYFVKKLMMQHELIGYIERLMRGIEVSDGTLAVDVIASVAPEGTFLSETHTVEHFRKELWFPELLDREFWQAWRDSGAKDMMNRCIEKKNEILAKHVPVLLPKETENEIDKILESARRNLSR